MISTHRVQIVQSVALTFSDLYAFLIRKSFNCSIPTASVRFTIVFPGLHTLAVNSVLVKIQKYKSTHNFVNIPFVNKRRKHLIRLA
jgi:hypothetical protein